MKSPADTVKIPAGAVNFPVAPENFPEGNLGDDFHDRESAWQNEGSELPSEWTPEHVQERLIAAFEVLRGAVGRVAPATFKSNWPAMLREFSDLVDGDAMQNERDKFYSARGRPSAHQIALMEEALAWPLQHLRSPPASPMEADALLLYCAARADDSAVTAALRKRAKRAKALIPGVVRSNQTQRRNIARDVAQWANQRVGALKPSQAYRVAHIRANARIRLERAIKDAGGLKINLKPKDVMPGKVMSRTWLDVNRKLGAARIARALNEREVEVR